jgi:hypothetical protein
MDYCCILSTSWAQQRLNSAAFIQGAVALGHLFMLQRIALVIATPPISTGKTKAFSVCHQCVTWNGYAGPPEKVSAWRYDS